MTANKKYTAAKKVGFLFAVFLLPASVCLAFYYFYIRKPLIIDAKAELYKNLAYYGPKMIDVNGDTIYNTIPDLNLTNQRGERISLAQLKGKVIVLNFFSLDNRDTYNRMTASLYRVQEKLSYLEQFSILSVSLNPVPDSVVTLRDLASKVHAEEGWHFTTGKQAEIIHAARVGFGIKKAEIDSSTVNKLYLLDLNRHIRGEYDGTKTTEVNRLLDEVKVLNAIYRIK